MFTANTETIVSSTEKTTFTCDRCSFSSTSKEILVSHFGEKHAVKATRYCGDELTLYFLETEEAFNAWVTYKGRDARVRYTTWLGPGWYSLSRWTSPCPKGCCTDSCMGTDFAENLVASRREEIREKAVALRELMRVLKEVP